MYYKHGETRSRLHKIWESMKCRCRNSNHPTYKCYGGRGITICQEWADSYIAFRDWSLMNWYDDSLELD